MERAHYLNKLIDEWGMPKTLQVSLLTLAAASIVVVVSANAIPNCPKLIEKENM